MKFPVFEREAHERWAEIPEEYREGIDALVVHREALPHPTQAGVHTLGMCLTEAYPSEWQGPETTRSVVALYWGSFVRQAAEDPEFDWKGEIWETLVHEVRHHLEWLAREDQLERVDYAMDQSFLRFDGEPWDPWYWQSGDEVAPGVFRVEYDLYIEQEWTPEELAGTEWIPFEWHGARYRIPAPGRLGDLHFILVHGLDPGLGFVELVLVRRRGRWERWKAAFGSGRPPEILESEGEAEPDPGGDPGVPGEDPSR